MRGILDIRVVTCGFGVTTTSLKKIFSYEDFAADLRELENTALEPSALLGPDFLGSEQRGPASSVASSSFLPAPGTTAPAPLLRAPPSFLQTILSGRSGGGSRSDDDEDHGEEDGFFSELDDSSARIPDPPRESTTRSRLDLESWLETVDRTKLQEVWGDVLRRLSRSARRRLLHRLLERRRRQEEEEEDGYVSSSEREYPTADPDPSMSRSEYVHPRGRPVYAQEPANHGPGPSAARTSPASSEQNVLAGPSFPAGGPEPPLPASTAPPGTTAFSPEGALLVPLGSPEDGADPTTDTALIATTEEQKTGFDVHPPKTLPHAVDSSVEFTLFGDFESDAMARNVRDFYGVCRILKTKFIQAVQHPDFAKTESVHQKKHNPCVSKYMDTREKAGVAAVMFGSVEHASWTLPLRRAVVMEKLKEDAVG